jgi:NAD(P)-dependent dehydrogenase (short-subunit alcohol dehydrogenase family)
MSLRFDHKVVLITGAGTGIGKATALAFAKEGASVMIGDVDPRAQATVDLIRATGGVADWRRTDVSVEAEVAALVAGCVERFGGLHVSFNNAGVLPPPRPFHEVPVEDFDRIISVDLRGVFLCMRAQIGHYLAAGGGVIVNTASVAGIVADPNMGPYVAAKHGVVGLTKAAAIEYARRNIRVNAIGPGFVATPMTQAWLDSEDFKRAFFAQSAMGRAADPSEIAGAVLHLSSEEASFTNGSLMIIDGGQTAH